jgi:nucleotide-binding universal stress UspA family protein
VVGKKGLPGLACSISGHRPGKPVKQIKKILVPLDLASDYKTIFPWVQEVAHKFSAAVYLLYVAQPVSYFPSFYVNIDMESFHAEVQVAARKQMAALAQDLLRIFPKLETRVEFGSTAEKILAVAEKEKMDMIIMGTSGREGIFGSVALKVVQAALCPVVTIHPWLADNPG